MLQQRRRVVGVALAPRESWDIIGFLEHDNQRRGERLNGIPIVSLEEAAAYHPDAYAVAAIGDPVVRERAVEEATANGFRFATLVHPTAYVDETARVEEGTMVSAGSIVDVNTTLRRHVLVNFACTVAHDSVLEEFATIGPGCRLSGNTRVGRSAYVGTGAVVISDIPDHVTAVGVPARVIKHHQS